MALRFSKHTGSGGGSKRFLRAFDEEYEDEDGVKGGDLKKGFLLGCNISRVVKVDCCPHLDKLIEELTKVCAVRYKKPPSDDCIQGLERAQAGNVNPSIMWLLPAFDYQKCLDDLVTPSWLVDTFLMKILGSPRMKLEGSSSALDLIRNARGSRASWSSRFRV
jgi:hypothetical protein